MILKNGKRIDGLGDSMPIGSIIEYNGTDIPDGWEKVAGSDNDKINYIQCGFNEAFWIPDTNYKLLTFNNIRTKGDLFSYDSETNEVVVSETASIDEVKLHFHTMITAGGELPVEAIEVIVYKNDAMVAIINDGLDTASSRSATSLDYIVDCAPGDRFRVEARSYNNTYQMLATYGRTVFSIEEVSSTTTNYVENELESYSSLTVANQTEITNYKSYGWVDAPLDRVVTQVGDKLTLVDNGVRIGPGVSHVRVSGYGIITVQNATSNSTYEYMCAIRKNADSVMWNRVPINANTTVDHQITVIPAMIIPVVEGDMIYLSSYSTTGQLTRTIHISCYLNVEVAGDVVKTEVIEYTGVTNYSTEEIVIGTYMGKPLYRKCFKHQFNGTYNDVAASGQMISWIYNATGAEVESIIRLDARAVNSGWDRIASLGYSFISSFGSIEYRTQSGSHTDVLQIGLIKDNPMYPNETIVLNDTVIDIIFEYTKTTD